MTGGSLPGRPGAPAGGPDPCLSVGPGPGRHLFFLTVPPRTRYRSPTKFSERRKKSMKRFFVAIAVSLSRRPLCGGEDPQGSGSAADSPRLR